MKKYYKVLGKQENKGKIEYYLLGYTSSKKAFLKESLLNGWQEKNLIFIKQ